MIEDSFSIFYILLCVLACLCLLRPQNKRLFIFTSLIATFILVCRGVDVGTDYKSYILNFQDNANSWDFSIGDNFGIDVGFVSLMYFFKKISLNYFIFFGIVYIVFYLCLLRYVKYKNVDYGWFIFLYFFLGYYFMAFNIMRQLMSIAIILLFIPLLDKKKYTYFAFIVIIVSLLFHKSEIEMLLLIPIHFISNKTKKINKPILLAILVGSFCVFYVGRLILYDSMSLLITLLQIENQYGVYIDRIDFRDGFGNMTSLLFTTFACLLVLCKNSRTYVFETNAVVLSYVLFNIGNMLATQATRIYLDFNVFILVLIPLMICEKGISHHRLFKIATIMLCLVYFSYSYIICNRDGIKPYYFFFEKQVEIPM